MLALSVSRVEAYLGCPLKYRFRYVDRIPAPWRVAAIAFGASVHAALEWFHRQRLKGRAPTAEPVQSIFAADWYAQNLEPLVFADGDSASTLREKGRAMVALYVEHADVAPQLVEKRFEVRLVDPTTGEVFPIKLRGVIDLVESGGTVVEFKTAARVLATADVERHLQVSTYALAFFLLHGRIPALRLDQLLKTRKPRLERFETTRTVEDLGWTARLIADVGRAIEAGHFYPSPSWRCTECEYFAHCQAWRGS